ncbi:MFS general substrate transporter [Lasiodiplodia theobromae]|uniref:MFS general substrate transporter n=1 Tax=Lasiodiplodia theobromae TaxID=45133 RepID=UPI0015C39ED4|nr:MFS general substrate transporter [Lasiodiplodia theobromae]KAF4537693.1 MFS general substrate transporter [Lasiodiplodia theobromae]
METQTISKPGGGQDAALAFAAECPAVPMNEATDHRVRRKIDRNLLPWMCGLYLLQYLDKTTLSYASSMGITADTNMTASQYSWTGSIFYIGYLALQYPHNRLMQRFPVARYVSVSVVVWGIILATTAATTDFAGIMTVRFFLGALEGAVTASFVLITARWYRASEQAFRTGIWFCFNGVAQIVGGALAYGVSRGFEENSHIHFSSWKALFLIAGIATSIYGVALFFFLPESPISAPWLSEEERHVAIERLRSNQQGVGSKVFKWYQFREAFTDVRTYLIFLFLVTVDIPCGGITVFFTQLIGGMGFDANTTFIITMPAGVVQVICNLGFSYLAQRTGFRMLSAVAAMCLSLFGIALMAGLARDGPTANTIGQIIGYYITIGNSATATILTLSNISSNTAGYTKKTTVNAVALVGYCVGFLIGPQTFRDGPSYTNAKINIIAQWFAALCFCLALHIVNKRENTRRDKLANFPLAQPSGQEFQDLTDKENQYFRYSL